MVDQFDYEMSRFFIAAGYVRGPEIVPEPLLTSAEAVVRDAFRAQVPPIRTNADGNVSRIDGLLDRDPVFLEILRSHAVAPLLTALLGPNVVAARYRHNHATLNRPGDIPYRLHRDVQQWSRPVASVFVYFEDANIDNGCTHVVPGTHHLPYAGPQSGDGGGNWADEHAEYAWMEGQSLPVPMGRGGVLVVNGLTFHSVGPNPSGHSRASMVFACHSADNLIAEADHRQFAELVCGDLEFKGNPALQVSGSLRLVEPASVAATDP